MHVTELISPVGAASRRDLPGCTAPKNANQPVGAASRRDRAFKSRREAAPTRFLRRLFLPVVIATAALAGCSSPKNEPDTFSGPTMGTTWSVKIADLPADLSHKWLSEEIGKTVEIVNKAMSTYRDDSDVVRFNRQTTTDWFPVSREVVSVASESLVVSQLSSGSFDITVNPLVDLWGFGATGSATEPPKKSEIAALLAQTGHHNLKIRLNPPALRKTIPGLSIDLSAIAKGFAVDRVAALLEERGSRNYLIEIGGELRARGHNADGIPWRIGVERPDPTHRQVEVMLPLRDLAMATSGDYRNFFDFDGQRYSHTIDPRTGAPVDHTLASVTVLAETAMRADALATALLVLGPKAGAELAETENIPAMFIERKSAGFDVTMSPALKSYIVSESGAESAQISRVESQ